MNNTKRVSPSVVKSSLRLERTDHFDLRFLQRRSFDLSGIAELRSHLCQAKIGEPVSVCVNNTVLVGKRMTHDSAILLSAYTVGEGDAA